MGAVSPQCLLPPQPPLQLEDTVSTDTNSDGTPSTFTTTTAKFTLHAFIVSPGFLGTMSILALPALAFFAISLAQCVVQWRTAAPRRWHVNVGAAAEALKRHPQRHPRRQHPSAHPTAETTPAPPKMAPAQPVPPLLKT